MLLLPHDARIEAHYRRRAVAALQPLLDITVNAALVTPPNPLNPAHAATGVFTPYPTPDTGLRQSLLMAARADVPRQVIRVPASFPSDVWYDFAFAIREGWIDTFAHEGATLAALTQKGIDALLGAPEVFTVESLLAGYLNGAPIMVTIPRDVRGYIRRITVLDDQGAAPVRDGEVGLIPVGIKTLFVAGVPVCVDGTADITFPADEYLPTVNENPREFGASTCAGFGQVISIVLDGTPTRPVRVVVTLQRAAS